MLATEPPAARFHFGLPGSVQGFTAVAGRGADGGVRVHNPDGRLAIDAAATVVTPTFVPDEARSMPIYGLLASPTLYPGQTIRAAASGPARTGIGDQRVTRSGCLSGWRRTCWRNCPV